MSHIRDPTKTYKQDTGHVSRDLQRERNRDCEEGDRKGKRERRNKEARE